MLNALNLSICKNKKPHFAPFGMASAVCGFAYSVINA